MKRYIFTSATVLHHRPAAVARLHRPRVRVHQETSLTAGPFVRRHEEERRGDREQARRVGMPFVNQRWLAACSPTFHRVQAAAALKELDEIDFNDVAPPHDQEGAPAPAPRARQAGQDAGRSGHVRVRAHLVVDTRKSTSPSTRPQAGIPVVAILDTNCDPDEVNFPIRERRCDRSVAC